MAQSVMMPSFSGGELSTNLYARVDLDKYHTGVATLRNFFVDYRGGVANRAGTKYITTCPTGIVRLISFIVSRDQSYILLFSNLQILVYLRGTLVATVVSPYVEDDIFQIRYVQSADVLTLAHPSYPVYNLNRTSATAFALVKETYGAGISPPNNPGCVATVSGTAMYYSYCVTAINAHGEESLASQPSNVGSKALDPTAATPVTISLSWNSVSGAKVYNVYKAGPTPAGSAMPTVFGYIGQSKITDFVDNNIGPDFSQVPPDYRDPFSPGQITDVTLTAGGTGASGDYISVTIGGDGTGAEVFAVTASGIAKGAVIIRGGIDYTTATATPASGSSTYTVTLDPDNHYPACVTYFQQRRCFAGADVSPDLIEMSKTGFYSNFDVSPAVLDSDAITINIASREVNNIEHMVPMSTGLVVFTRGNAFLLTGGGQSGAVTPTNIAATPQASTGAGPLPPLVVNYNILFQQYEGTVIRDMAFQWQTSSYFGTDRSMLANHLFFEQTLTDWAFASEPNHLLHVVREDGKMLAMAYVPEQEVYGWAQWDTQGQFMSVASIPEDGQSAVYVVVKRHIPNDAGDPCWVNYLERFATREDCCVFEDWFLDSAVPLSAIAPDFEIFLSASTGDITVYAYDPCETAPAGPGPFSAINYLLEEKSPYGGSLATLVADSDTSLRNASMSHEYMGLSYSPVSRRIYFSACVIIDDGVGDVGDYKINHTAYTLYAPDWGTVAPLDSYDASFLKNFYLCYLDIDTDAVTMLDVWDSTSAIPVGIHGSDGTWRRMFQASVGITPTQEFKVVDPVNTGNEVVWVHTTGPECQIYRLQESEGFKHRLFPLDVPGSGHMEMLGLTANWMLVMSSTTVARSNGSLYTVPRVVTADEVTADSLLGYFFVAEPAWMDTAYWCSLIANDGKCYIFGHQRSGTRDYRLYRYDPPASVGSWMGSPQAGGTFTNITPWSGSTGPNTSVSSYIYDTKTGSLGHNDDKLQEWSLDVGWKLPASSQFVLLSQLTPQNTTNAGTNHDPADYRIDCTYYDIGGASFDYHQAFVTGYMKSDWTTTADPAEAAYAVQFFREMDPYREMSNFDYGDDYTRRWIAFTVQPVVAGVFTWSTATNRVVFAKYHFVSGSAPTLLQFEVDASWLANYPDYATRISNSNVVEQSIQASQEFTVGGERYRLENGFVDATGDSPIFWFGGQNAQTKEINTAFPTYTGEAGPYPPSAFVKLSFNANASGVTSGDILQIGCGKIAVDEVAEDGQSLTGTVVSPLDVDLPDDPATPEPIAADGWTVVTPTSTLTGLDHLEGKEVYALADGKVVGPVTVASGSIPLGFSASSVVAGLQYTSQFKTLRLDVGEPTIQGKRKIIQSLQLRVKCSVGFEVGTTDFSAIYQPKTNYPDFAGGPSAYTAYVQGGAAAIPFSGDVLVNVQAGWERDGVLTVQQSLPLPVTILGLIPEVTVGDNQR